LPPTSIPVFQALIQIETSMPPDRQDRKYIRRLYDMALVGNTAKNDAGTWPFSLSLSLSLSLSRVLSPLVLRQGMY